MIRVRQVEVDVDKYSRDEIINSISRKLRINRNSINGFQINKMSIDARRKPYLKYILEVDINVSNEFDILDRYKSSNDVLLTPNEDYTFKPSGVVSLKNRPLVVGSGPAGLFLSYMLALNGYKPLVIERGKCVDERVKMVDEFWKTGKLDLNTNVQFGEGGAGTFSDGKLNTLVKDPMNRCKLVFKTFVECGADPEIMYDFKPHIGTDVLRDVVSNLRNKIISLGGEFRYNTTLTDIIVSDNKIIGAILNNNERIDCEVIGLCIGHSARDTFKMLLDKDVHMEPKPFAIGVRIQHSQEMINLSQYGVKNHELLGAAPYKLTHKASNGRGVYTFCMCPGGYVVNSSSEDKRLAINGMSYNKRDSKNANSAILVTITPADFGSLPMDGINFQRELEEKAYSIGKGLIPVQLFKDYKDNRISTNFLSVDPLFKGGYTFANINEIFPSYINDSLKEGIDAFGYKIKGFNNDDAILAAVESRTSSPVKIVRDDEGLSSISGLYPCGEGAGYAGGITSAAMDGIKVFEYISSKYKSFE